GHVPVVRQDELAALAEVVIYPVILARVLARTLVVARTRAVQDHAARVVPRLHGRDVRVILQPLPHRARLGPRERVAVGSTLNVRRLPVTRKVTIEVVAAARVAVAASVTVGIAA